MAEEALWQLDRTKLEAVAAEAGRVGYSSADVTRVGELLLLPAVRASAAAPGVSLGLDVLLPPPFTDAGLTAGGVQN